MDVMTISQIAKKYGITPGRVYQLAEARGIKGQKIGHLTVFTPAEVKALKPGPTGRPRKDKR